VSCCSVLQCACHVAVCCSVRVVLQVCCSVHVMLQCVAVCMPCCSVLQCACRVAVRCSVHAVLQCVAVCESRLGHAPAFLRPSAVLLDCVAHCTLKCTTNALCGYMRERERVHGCVESTETQRESHVFLCVCEVQWNTHKNKEKETFLRVCGRACSPPRAISWARAGREHECTDISPNVTLHVS